MVVNSPSLAITGEEVLKECNGVTDLPEDLQFPRDAELWAIDRANLGECKRLNEAKGQAIRILENQSRLSQAEQR